MYSVVLADTAQVVKPFNMYSHTGHHHCERAEAPQPQLRHPQPSRCAPYYFILNL